jgi:hypothetical protein
MATETDLHVAKEAANFDDDRQPVFIFPGDVIRAWHP